MFVEIKNAEYLDGYRLRLSFNNGEVRVVDLEYHLNGPIFRPLANIEYFKRFSIPLNTVQWENGADFAPEFLYEISNPECHSK
jgi:hypothetical protein